MSSRQISTTKSWAKHLPVSAVIQGDALEVTYPGFVREDTNSKGGFRPNKIAKATESSRSLSLRLLPCLKDISFVNRTVVVLSCDYVFKPEVYLMIADRTSKPYKITNIVSSVGSSSFVLEQSLSKEHDSTTLIKCLTTVVYVDWSSRRPVPLPTEMKHHVPKRESKAQKVKLPEIPHEAFSYEVEILASDMDTNRHTNHSVYVRICSDTAYVAAAKSFYRGMQDVPTLPLLEMWTFYCGESVEGDFVSAYTWQDIDAFGNIYFAILKEKTPIFYCRWKVAPRFVRIQSAL